MPFRMFHAGWYAAVLVAAVVMLHACDSGSTQTGQPTPEERLADAVAADNPTTDPTTLPIRDENAIDIGDVEQAIDVVGVVSELSKADNITEEVIADRRKRIRAVNITVDPPNPSTLWVNFRVECTREFVERPVVLDSQILVDGELMDSFTMVLSKGANKNTFRHDIEVLFGRAEIPETMLVTVKSEALLLPEDIDLSTTDPISVTEGVRTSAIYFAPIRIDFTEPGPKGSDSEPAAAPETPDDNPS